MRTTEGNSYGAPCCFPFNYEGVDFVGCTMFDSKYRRPWCSTTPNYDADEQWGYCQSTSLTFDRFSLDSRPNKVFCGTRNHLSRYSKNVLKEPVFKDRKVLAYLCFDNAIIAKGFHLFFYVIQITFQLSNLFHNSGINFVYVAREPQS